jgi:hypothetical protein
MPEMPLPAADDVKLDAQQCARLIRDSEADEVAAHFALHDPALLSPHAPSSAHELVLQALRRADRYGIADADRIGWCRLFVRQPLLEQLPDAIPLLKALWSKECRYADIESALMQLARQ